ncbi:putative PEP-binding protein [Leptolyngbya sp. PCC 6406]|uniref:putative PEP-binding protein n=1 Tax=Leptolyngbya sp. PCC 6406 TaxID=1173264 RepID=UPI0002AC7D96|nr:putative PEP-binding protein [Leptolyngbya sp. PCC 6406]
MPSLPAFISLNTRIPMAKPEVGELAWELARLNHLGLPVVSGWVVPATVFEQALQNLVSREPLLADWPHLLGQAELTAATSLPRLSQRLRQPLLMAQLNLPWADLFAKVNTPVLRLQPSLWWPGKDATSPLAQVLGEVLCWADEQSLAQGIKTLWGRMVSGHSWAYWQRSPSPPTALRLAIVIQPMVSTRASGLMWLRGKRVQIQAIQGNLQGFAEAIPDRYDGGLQVTSGTGWQLGYQERVHQPARPHYTLNPEDCLVTYPARGSALDIVQPDQLQTLVDWVSSLGEPTTWQVAWQLPVGAQTLSLTQAMPWPLAPPVSANCPQEQPTELRLVGRGAAPGRVIGPALVLQAGDVPPRGGQHHILVATHISPAWLPYLKTAAALVSEQGGLTCHGAILARELGIPAVIGIADATQHFRTGETLHLDGDRGVVERFYGDESRFLPGSPVPSDSPVPSATVPTLEISTGHLCSRDRLGDLPVTLAEAIPSHLTPQVSGQISRRVAPELWVNVTQPEAARAAARLPVAGVGLLRSEWLLLPQLDQRHPYQWLKDGDGKQLQERLVQQLRPILAAFAPRPVRYRSLDLRSHEMLDLAGAPPPEVNPMLGLRGTFSYQQHPDLFRLELAALRQLQQEGYDNLQLLLPFVRTVEEFCYCQDLVIAAQLTRSLGFQLWIMAEVPSVLFLLPAYGEAGVQGIAIGTNDLTQLLLGVDRDQAALSQAFDERHPAVQGAIAQLIQQAQTLNLPTSICGLAPSRYPEMVADLIRWGITGISVDLASVTETAAAIAQVTPAIAASLMELDRT